MEGEEVSKKVYHLGLTGWPLLGSSSPALHLAALSQVGLEGEYRLYPVPPGPDGEPVLQDLLGRLREKSLDGLNVTIPHKQRLLAIVDRLTPVSSTIGAVNTLFLQDGDLVGDNTDAPGFRKDLERVTGWRLDQPQDTPVEGNALVLGAGGAARAVVYVLGLLGWKITLAARRTEQADELAHELGRVFIQAPRVAALSDLPLLMDRQDALLMVNTTPLGMEPDVEASPFPNDLTLPKRGFVYDLITRPRQTKLMKQAQARGIPAVNGLGMLVEQAALAFEQWTHQPASREAMWVAVQAPSSSNQPTKENA